ncbi:hypothetical protein N9O05_02025 [Pelagibacteraceae bacterium]|nr:hypothetical protein [Pelagibacteraceae bacterium]|tara:strand:+ start:188 stop:415 length:228 start_codon:yes stop_codon:yes gene_type:complete
MKRIRLEIAYIYGIIVIFLINLNVLRNKRAASLASIALAMIIKLFEIKENINIKIKIGKKIISIFVFFLTLPDPS